MPPRETALSALIACRKQAAWSNGVLKSYIARDNLDRRDAALATRLCYGVLQNRGRLDFYLKQLLTGRAKDLHPGVRDILHLGLYQLYFMDKIPNAAAVNESVALAKKYCKSVGSAPGLVNGVLRSAARRMGTLEEPATLADKYSHPQALVDLLRGYLGEDRLEAMLAANNEAPEPVIQVNTLKISADALLARLEQEGAAPKKHPWMENCLILSSAGNLEKLPAFREGLFYVQDAAARLAVDCAGLIPGDYRVADCCAAPGGKSFAAAIAMGGKGRIFSADLHAHRVELIEKGAQRLGLTGITARQQDAAADCFDPESMDAVIVDVPCSGYGIIRKKPDIRYKDPDSMKDLPALQLAILKNQARRVRPGGVVIYATCTLVRRENEGVVEKFLKACPEFTLENLPLPAVFEGRQTAMLRLLPGEYDTDGFFICRMRREK